LRSATQTRRSGARNGSGRRISALNTLNTAVVAPTASATVTTIAAAVNGDLPSMRQA